MTDIFQANRVVAESVNEAMLMGLIQYATRIELEGAALRQANAKHQQHAQEQAERVQKLMAENTSMRDELIRLREMEETANKQSMSESLRADKAEKRIAISDETLAAMGRLRAMVEGVSPYSPTKFEHPLEVMRDDWMQVERALMGTNAAMVTIRKMPMSDAAKSMVTQPIHPWIGKRVKPLFPGGFNYKSYGIVTDAEPLNDDGFRLTIKLDDGDTIARDQHSNRWKVIESDFATDPTPPIVEESPWKVGAKVRARRPASDVYGHIGTIEYIDNHGILVRFDPPVPATRERGSITSTRLPPDDWIGVEAVQSATGKPEPESEARNEA